MPEPSASKIILIVGVWRSGTSLLHAMLNQHSQIALMFEAEPFGLFPLRKETHFPDDWRERLEFFNQTISRHRLDPAGLPLKQTGRECLLAMYRMVGARKNAKIIGGKSPTYHAWLPKIANIFPEAEFIIIWRNPLDNCRSVVEAGRGNRFFNAPGIVTRAYFGGEQMLKGVRQLRAGGRRVHEVLFNDLIASPEAELRKICDFIGVEFEPAMLDLHTADLSMVPAGNHHDPLRSGIVQKNHRHREILPRSLIEKDRRYLKLWRDRYGDSLFVRAMKGDSAGTGPGVVERGVDWTRYWFWRLWSRLKNKLIRRTPIAFWQQLRGEEPKQMPAQASSAKKASGTKFSIITPSFRSSRWLKLCIASVADQQGVECEHIVQDSCSDDGTQDWLPKDGRVKAFIEKDNGMYDAVNRGYRRATGDILAYLNCDEQYLPGALEAVRDFFEENPSIEVALAGTIVTDGNGQYVCHRHQMVPHPQGIRYRFPILTSSIFIRRRVISERGLYFDAKWRDLGDYHWVLALVKNRVPMAVCHSFTSVFADTGENMNLKPNALREKSETDKMIPPLVRTFRPFWILQHRLRRLAAGHFFLKPMSYDIYTLDSPDRRVRFEVAKPTAVWWNRL